MPDTIIWLPIVDAPLMVDVIDGEIVLDGMKSIAPSLTAAAARATARLLIDAADRLDGARAL